MPVVIGCLMPHPPVIIPEVGRENLDRVTSTVQAMQEATAEIAKAEPDTLVFISPHSCGFTDGNAVKVKPDLTGSFAAFGISGIDISARSDLEFIGALLSAANDYDVKLEKIGPGFISITGSEELDHGVLVPLYYLKKVPDRPIVSISVSLEAFDTHYALGVAIQKAANDTGRRVAIIASGDLSHRLIPGAPAGYNPRAIDFDAKIEEIFDTGYFDELKGLDRKLIEDAGECGLRSIYTLAGAFNGLEVRTKVLSYEGPFGVGYMVATVYPGLPAPERDLYTIQIEGLPSREAIEPSAPVRLAMYSLEQYYEQGHPVTPPENTPAELFERRAGAFVCLKINGDLRGCMGTIEPTQANIAEEIMTNAIQAAMADPRFVPVSLDELPNLQFTVDIIEEPERIGSKEELDPKVYGVIVRQGYKSGLLLPDIEGVDTVDRQIAIAKQKAGIPLHESAELYRFRVTRYE